MAFFQLGHRFALAWVSCAAALAFGGCAHRTDPSLQRVSFSKPQMGVPFELTFYIPAGRSGVEVAEKVFKRIEELNAILSDYETDSELNQLSRTGGSGQWIRVSPELWFVLHNAQEIAKASDGAFDITLGPLTSLWRKARREKRFPQPHHLQAARALVNHQWIELDSSRRQVRLAANGMRLDLGGIAKGYAADEALKVLRRENISRALVAAAGDITAGDPPPGKKGWRIVLENPGRAEVVLLRNAAVSTSGDLFQFLEVNGVRYSHILDPQTGLGLTNQVMVSVRARDGITADSLATALSVMPPPAGLRLARKYGAEARLLIQGTGKPQMVATPGFQRHLILDSRAR